LISIADQYSTLQNFKRLNLTTLRRSKPRDLDTENLNHAIIEGIRDKKGKNIIQLDLRRLEDAPADFFIICEGDSSTHIKAISDSIYKKVKEDVYTTPSHTEGSTNARWVLMDYFNTVVHVFYPETRQFYELEQLWSDAESTEFAEV
jgi:ribosome-associated protein